MAITAYDSEMQVSAAGMPNIQKLIKTGVLKPEDIDPETGLRKQPKSGFRLVLKTIKDRETGKRVQVELKDHCGHTENPDCKGWRIGLNPEKYWSMLLAETENRLRGRKDKYAPELTVDEANAFEKWLNDKLEEEPDLLDDEDEVPRDPVVRKVRKKKARQKEEGQKEVRKPGRPPKAELSTESDS